MKARHFSMFLGVVLCAMLMTSTACTSSAAANNVKTSVVKTPAEVYQEWYRVASNPLDSRKKQPEDFEKDVLIPFQNCYQCLESALPHDDDNSVPQRVKLQEKTLRYMMALAVKDPSVREDFSTFLRIFAKGNPSLQPILQEWQKLRLNLR